MSIWAYGMEDLGQSVEEKLRIQRVPNISDGWGILGNRAIEIPWNKYIYR